MKHALFIEVDYMGTHFSGLEHRSFFFTFSPRPKIASIKKIIIKKKDKLACSLSQATSHKIDAFRSIVIG